MFSASVGSDGKTLISQPDGELPALHPSWLDANADLDLSLLPAEIVRTIANGVVSIEIYPGTINRVTIRGGDKSIPKINRLALWSAFPVLPNGIAKKPPPTPKPEKPAID